MLAWQAILAQAERLGVTPFVRLPGSVPNASQCLSAFDVFLNTSRYEGLSIATLEALASGLSVVASRVGGQGEVGAPGLSLLAFDAPDAAWAAAVAATLGQRPEKPAWLGFPAIRVWTLCHLAPAVVPGRGVLFVTANLNAGGAQRSLTNLAVVLRDRIPLEIAVCGDSSADAFSGALRAAGVVRFCTAASRDCFDHAEALVRRIAQIRPAAVCFWNVDPKVKLLVTKTLAFTGLRFIDVSPGAYAFEELDATREFQQWIAYSEAEYCARLDCLVLKYRAAAPEGLRVRTATIPNGVAISSRTRDRFDARLTKVVVSGRVAPSKFLVEIVAAMRRVWAQRPDAELHVLGTAELRHREYADAFLHAAGDELGRRVHVHGAAFDAPERLADYDVAIVLGEHQGCPNAVLEALAAGVPVVANDSGGTRELIVDGQTGLLVRDRDPTSVAAALLRILSDTALAQRLSRAGRARVMRRYSMQRMADAYVKLFNSV
jgi:glycosyltransferase involved in cell wall biosynthesis